jgi:tRNA A-37 threonylcarbamoyl transferase component Bud32
VIGRSIGNYKIARVLGEGGMGTVYLAEHPMIGKRVAVKMLRPDLGTDPGLVSRFFQEAKAVNEIRHPNIVDISDFGHTDDGIVYFVMELLEGQSLRDRLTAGPMPIDQTITVARQVIDALAAAHRVGIIHRDLKPDNIFLVGDAELPGGFRAKLFDFGVAKLLGDKQQQVGHKTIDGAVVGTPFYMSPEQALCHDVGVSADVYAMGVVIYEMLTGTVPFQSEQLVLLLNAILKQPAPPPSRLRPSTPAWLDRLVLRCLEKDPEARPRSMEEVNAVLAAGSAEMSGGEAALGEAALGATMIAPAGIVPAPAGAATAQVRASVARQPTIASSAAVPAEDASTSATQAPRQTAARGGTARPSEPKGGLRRLRDYLDTRRVQRVAIPLIVIVAVIVVASIFLSAAAQRPVTELVPDLASPPPPPSHASIHLNSEPAGAEVIRLTDNRQLGTTPLVDIRPADGRQVNYRFHRAGYTDVQIPFQITSAGKFELTATLIPVERHSEAGMRSSPSGRHHGHEHKQPVAEERAVPVPVATPVAQPQDLSPSGLPPLGDRNPIKRLRR